MKISLAVVAMLAATASAIPMRMVVASSESPIRYDGIDGGDQDQIVKGNAAAPCHGKTRGTPSGPIGALLSRLGLAPSPAHSSRWEVISAIKQEEEAHRFIESFEKHVEEMVKGAQEEIVPFLEGGSVGILPVLNEQGDFDMDVSEKQHAHKHHDHHPHQNTEDRISGWKSLEGKGGIKKHHHKHHGAHTHGHRKGKTFACRFRRALHSLSPAEALTLAFVLGAGAGSILHFIFMIFLISIRFLRCSKTTREERRAARRARREARKAAKAARKAGAVRLEGEEGVSEVHDEVLPSYAEEETARLVEKA